MKKLLSLAFASSLATVVILGIDLPIGDASTGGGGSHTNGHIWCC